MTVAASSFATRIVRILALALAGLVACGVAPHAVQADTDGVLPVCGSAFTLAQWFQPNPLSEITGYEFYKDPQFIGPGLKYECASQNYITTEPCPDPANCGHVPNGFARLTAATIFPDTIDAAGGDNQTVTVDLGAVTLAGWGGCFPGSTISPGFCPTASLQGYTNNGGTMLFRLRQPDGLFRGLWSLSRGEGENPGFRLEHVGFSACATTSPTCTFDVVFQRDLTNLPVIRKDAQVLLQLLVGNSVASVPIAVPMLVKQAGGPLNETSTTSLTSTTSTTTTSSTTTSTTLRPKACRASCRQHIGACRRACPGKGKPRRACRRTCKSLGRECGPSTGCDLPPR